ncbi:hypothetical protein BE21_58670 [Sorangium cellulosum]|uniref:Uncharacterized protein n=1 Tax=Sorangium cellulosum TaxID=56 RepID=A0A150U261_SORCE|nr:hypothetical protein BE21_58670 [Sorangium cellulosum]
MTAAELATVLCAFFGCGAARSTGSSEKADCRPTINEGLDFVARSCCPYAQGFFAWDGHGCRPLPCGCYVCRERPCEEMMFKSWEACEAAHAACPKRVTAPDAATSR